MTTPEEKTQIARINRNLAKDSWYKVQTTRSESVRHNHGRFILVDVYHNALVDADNSLEALESRLPIEVAA